MLAKYEFPLSNFVGSEKNLSRKNFFVVWMLYAIVDDGRSVYLHICTFSEKDGSLKRKWEIKLIAKLGLVHFCGNETIAYFYIKGYL